MVKEKIKNIPRDYPHLIKGEYKYNILVRDLAPPFTQIPFMWNSHMTYDAYGQLWYWLDSAFPENNVGAVMPTCEEWQAIFRGVITLDQVK